MIVFTTQDWVTSLIFVGIFAVIVFVPCALVTLLGRKMINRLGQQPSQTPFIQLSIFFPLVLIEVITFTLMIYCYQFFIN